jgi:hypothetical protein
MGKIKVGSEEVELDEKLLIVTMENINEFLSGYASWYRYYQNKHSDASLIARKYTDKHAALLQAKFKQYKIDGGYSDKMAEACAKSDEEVIKAQENMRFTEYVKDEIWGYLKSMDYAHANALQLCYNMRKEMDKIGGSYVRHSDDIDYNKIEAMYKKDKE